MTERVKPSSFYARGDRLLVDLSSSYSAARPGDTQTATTSSNVPVEKPERVKRDTTSKKRAAENLSSKPGLVSEI